MQKNLLHVTMFIAGKEVFSMTDIETEDVQNFCFILNAQKQSYNAEQG